MKKNKKNLIIVILSFVILLLISLLTFYYIKSNTPFLSSINILGQKFDIKPGVYVYEFDIDNAVIDKDDSGTGCTPEYEYSVSNFYKNSYNNLSAIKYFVEGQTYGDFRLKFTKNGKVVAYYYFTLNFDKPLKIVDGC